MTTPRPPYRRPARQPLPNDWKGKGYVCVRLLASGNLLKYTRAQAVAAGLLLDPPPVSAKEKR